MANNFIYISSAGLIWYQRSRHTIDEIMHCVDVSAAEPEISAYLDKNGIEPVIVVLDIAEESYALESIPHLNRQDRSALIERKIKQLFPRTRFHYSAVHGRNKSGRRDDQVFFSAITDDYVIKPWLTLLHRFQIPVIAIQSLPILSEKIANVIPGGEQKFLIIVTEDHLGVSLRQSYFKNNRLALSRFRQLKTTDLAELSTIVKEEVDRSRRFVTRQFHLAQDARLAAHFFYSSAGTYEFFKEIDFSAMNLESTSYLINDYARDQKLRLSDNSGMCQLLAAQSSESLSVSHYQDQQSQYYYAHHLLKKGLNLASTLITVEMAIYIGLAMMENFQLKTSIKQLQKQQIEIIDRLSKTVEAPLTNNFNPFEIRAQLNLLKQLQQQTITPEAVLTPVSQVLQRYPTISLSSVAWGSKDDASQQQVLESIDPAQSPGNEHRLVSLRLTASVAPFDGNYRKALALIERVAKEFGEMAQIENVKIVKWPIEINARNELSGTISQPTQDSEFMLEMQWQHL